jgi:serine/threonine-protein kinase
VQVATEICDALEGVHARGFVHRDLKPENIFLVPVDEQRLQVKLLDFGIAKLCPGDVPAPTLTAPEVTMGTPQYVSPEQARGKPVGPSSDVYALGVLCYELFVGELPFAADSTIDFLMKHVSEAPIAPRQLWSGIPTSLETLLLRMLAKEPAERPHVVDVRAALAAVLDEVSAPVAEAPPATTDRVARPPRLSIRATVGAFAAMLVLAGVPAGAPPSPATVVAPATPAEVEPPPLPEVVAAAAPVAAAVEAAPGPAPSPKAARKSRPRRAAAPAKPTVDDDTLVDPFPQPSAEPR